MNARTKHIAELLVAIEYIAAQLTPTEKEIILNAVTEIRIKHHIIQEESK